MPRTTTKDVTAAKAEIARACDPYNLALSFLNDYVHIDGDILGKHESYFTVRKWRGEYFHWRDGRYQRISDDTLSANTTHWLQLNQGPGLIGIPVSLKVTRNLVSNVLLNIDPLILIRETCELNDWIGGGDRVAVIPVSNGLLALQGEAPVLIPHTPAYFSLTRLPFNYDQAAKCPTWKGFLKDVMDGDDDRIDLLQRWVGYLFRPDLQEQKFLLCVGEGANGKGVFFEVVQALVGTENCSQVGLARFGNPFALYATLGKVVNATNESSHIIEEEAESILKSFVAGDRFTFERKFREPVQAVPTAKIMISTNALPRFTDKTQGIWRRILLVPFDRTIPEEQQVKGLAGEIIATELPGVFNWALEGLRRLNRAGGFTLPEKSKALLEDYRRDADPARAFLLENYTHSPNAYGVVFDTLYGEYKAWCQSNGCCALGNRQFGKQVRRIFPGVDRERPGSGDSRPWVYRGLVPVTSHTSHVIPT
jgi:P4 family phage/plasmid primase-like protien